MKWKFIIVDSDGVVGTNSLKAARAAAQDEEATVINCEHGEVVMPASSAGHDVVDMTIYEQTTYALG